MWVHFSTLTTCWDVFHLCRCFLSSSWGPAQSPACSGILEAVIVQLCQIHPSDVTVQGKTVSRWQKILSSIAKIGRLVLSSSRVMEETNLQLLDINQGHGGDQPSTAWHQPGSWRRPTFNCLTSTRVMEETNLQLPEINQSHGGDQPSTAWDQPESWKRPTFNCRTSTRVMEETNLQLPDINHRTLSHW